MVRLPPKVHRNPAIQAAESGVSINRLVSAFPDLTNLVIYKGIGVIHELAYQRLGHGRGLSQGDAPHDQCGFVLV
ncbi:MAG: toxin-antitoxin system HicB family antitoxin [Deltaproteobacteria bacterium]|nr:toxin-antitoxin system HicB family antitoxin [Deltaproteobacteria bacterium]